MNSPAHIARPESTLPIRNLLIDAYPSDIRRTRAAVALDITRPESHRSPLANPLANGTYERVDLRLLRAGSLSTYLRPSGRIERMLLDE